MNPRSESRIGQGRLVTVVVVVPGSASGVIYDAANTIPVPVSDLFTIPMTAGVYPIGLPVNYGIVVAPGTGQTVTVGYT